MFAMEYTLGAGAHPVEHAHCRAHKTCDAIVTIVLTSAMPYQDRHVPVAIVPLRPVGPLRIDIRSAMIAVLTIALGAAATGSLLTARFFSARSAPVTIANAQVPLSVPFRPAFDLRATPSRFDVRVSPK